MPHLLQDLTRSHHPVHSAASATTSSSPLMYNTSQGIVYATSPGSISESLLLPSYQSTTSGSQVQDRSKTPVLSWQSLSKVCLVYLFSNPWPVRQCGQGLYGSWGSGATEKGKGQEATWKGQARAKPHDLSINKCCLNGHVWSNLLHNYFFHCIWYFTWFLATLTLTIPNPLKSSTCFCMILEDSG